jgi:two-component system, OmpR family, sensor histidine kinase MprB
VTGPLPAMRRPVDAVDRRWHSAPLSTRLTAAAALAATFAIVAVVAVAYVAVRHELLSNIDSQLRHQVKELQFTPVIGPVGPELRVDTQVGDVGGYAQLVSATGQTQPAMGQSVVLAPTAADEQVASKGGSVFRDGNANGLHLRVLSTPLADVPGTAVLIALPLTATDSQLHKLRLAFLVLALLGLGLVVSGSWIVVRRTLRPVATLTDAAEQIAVTRDLTTRIEDYGTDELGRLASTFNTMLDALERSVGQQRQLILDASHELRTPLSSLRTNVEVLHDVERLSVDQRRALLNGIVTQLDELTGLVADVVELARGDAPESAQEDVALDDLVSQAVDRARRHWPNVIFMLDAQPVMVRGVPNRLDRAIANLLDNAGKFSPAGSVVDTTVTAAGVLTFADRGPGVPADAIDFVFDRFYRADVARAMPGSGLGLAIVKQVIDGHNGTVTLSNRTGGGTLVTVTLTPLDERHDQVPLVEAAVVDTQPVA